MSPRVAGSPVVSPQMVRPLVEVGALTVRFARQETPAVAGISFDIEPGECVGLVGESGSGKSVTARALLGLASGASVDADMLRFGDTDLRGLSLSRWRALRGSAGGIGYIPQAALVGLDPLRPVGREIADTLRLHTRASAAERAARVIELLTAVGMPEPELRAGQRPYELSGGLRQRALIASAIALGPRLLIADEPTTALDSTVQAGILDLLHHLQSEGTAVLLISHDLAVVSRLASRVAVMQAGSLVEFGPTRRVLDAPQHPYTRRLVAAVPTSQPRGRRLSPSALPVALPVYTPPVAEPTAPPREIVLEARGLSRRFGERQAVDSVSFTLGRGETLGIVGESGSGKTTLARLVLALEHPDAGEVRLFGEEWSTSPEGQRRSRRPLIGAIYQDALSSFDPRLTVGQILGDALRVGAGVGEAAAVETANRTPARRAAGGDNPWRTDLAGLLDAVHLPRATATRRPRFLSGGQQQRVAIARAIAARPAIIVCDEPVSSLDVSVQAQILDLLDDLQSTLGLSYLFITHDLGVVRHASDDVLVMKDGRVLESGPTETVFSAPTADYTRALLAAAPEVSS